MSKFKLFVLLILVAVVAVGGYTYFEQNFSGNDSRVAGDEVSSEQFIEASGISWFQDPLKTVSITIFDNPINVVFTAENAQRIKEQALLNDFALAVNGGYFRGSYIDAEYAGLLQVKGELIEKMVPDDQLTQVVVYDEELDIVTFEPVITFNPEGYSSENYTLFQTGPLIIDANQVQTEEIASSVNGRTRHLRTVFGYTDSGKKFFIVTRVNYSLEELAEEILLFDVFSGETIYVVNLDGGTSSAMYSEDLDQFNFGESKRLPVIIGVE